MKLGDEEIGYSALQAGQHTLGSRRGGCLITRPSSLKQKEMGYAYQACQLAQLDEQARHPCPSNDVAREYLWGLGARYSTLANVILCRTDDLQHDTTQGRDK